MLAYDAAAAAARRFEIGVNVSAAAVAKMSTGSLDLREV